MISSVLFDLDGTLTDPTEGIVKSMQYALTRMGRPVPIDKELIQFIGASIQPTFVRLLNSTDQSLIEEGIRFFRERYSTTGLFENSVYSGVPEMLELLRRQGFMLFVVTAKPKVFSEKIVKYFELDKWIREVHGPSLEEREYTKAKIIESVLSSNNINAETTVMVGDRREDILAGKSNGAITIGVTYGSGSREEISGSSPNSICHSPFEIGQALLKL